MRSPRRTVAGALTLEDGALVVAVRSRLLRELAGGGGMVSLACGAERAGELIGPWGARLSVAAVNGVSAVVVSGEVAACEELVALCEGQGVRARRVEVDYASHSPQVETIQTQLVAALAGIQPRSSSMAFFSTLTGESIDTAELDAQYWYRSLREPVEFEAAVRGRRGRVSGVSWRPVRIRCWWPRSRRPWGEDGGGGGADVGSR